MMCVRGLFILAILLFSHACVSPGYRPFVSLSDLKADEVVLVGKIRLKPKLAKDEQDFSGTIGAKRMKGKIYITVDNKHNPVKDYISLNGIKNVGEVEANKTFAVVVKKTKPLIYSGAFVYVSNSDYYILPGGIKIRHGNKDRALYIGTIEYTRNMFNEITRVKIKNQYAEAKRFMRKKFGSQLKLKRIKPVLLKAQKP